MPGPAISSPEVTNISRHGFRVLVDDRELILPFESFPWFRAAAVGDIHQVERPQPDHLYRPRLDVDLSLDSIEDPDRYPLVSDEGQVRSAPETGYRSWGPRLPIRFAVTEVMTSA
jgi:Protein of unknown function (DUF2442)